MKNFSFISQAINLISQLLSGKMFRAKNKILIKLEKKTNIISSKLRGK